MGSNKGMMSALNSPVPSYEYGYNNAVPRLLFRQAGQNHNAEVRLVVCCVR